MRGAARAPRASHLSARARAPSTKISAPSAVGFYRALDLMMSPPTRRRARGLFGRPGAITRHATVAGAVHRPAQEDSLPRGREARAPPAPLEPPAHALRLRDELRRRRADRDERRGVGRGARLERGAQGC